MNQDQWQVMRFCGLAAIPECGMFGNVLELCITGGTFMQMLA